MATIRTDFLTNTAEVSAEYQKMAAIVRRFTADVENQGARNLQRSIAEVRALKLEASGHAEAAAAARQKIAIAEEAHRLAKQTGTTEARAMAIVKTRIQLENQLAAAKARAASIGATGPGGRVALPELPLTTAEMNRAFVATERVNHSLRSLHKSGKAGGLGFLAVSQAVEDAQYGLKGVLNNIPQAVLGFGGSAGLAGAFSLAAVAAYSFYRAVQSFSGLDDAIKYAERSRKATDAFTEALLKNKQAFEDRQAQAARGSLIASIGEQESLRRDRLLSVDESSEAEFQKQARALERVRQARDELMAARSSGPNADPAEAIRARFANAEADAAENLARAQRRLTDTGKEWQRVWQGLRETGGDLFNKAAKAAAEAEKLQFLMDGREQELAAMRADAEGLNASGPAFKLAQTQIREKEKAIASLVRQMDEQRAKEKAYNDEIAKNKAAGQASIQTLNARIAAAKEEIEVQRERIRLNRELAKAEADRIKAESTASRKRFSEELELLRAKLAGDQAAMDAIDRRRRIEEEITRLMKEQVGLTREQAAAAATQKADLEDQLRNTKEKGQQRSVFIQAQQEIQVLRLRAAGREKQAKALEQEFQARAEALRLAKEANITEAEAIKMVRERQKLENAISQGAEKHSKRARNLGSLIRKNGSTELFHGPSKIPSAQGINAAGGRRIDAAGGRRIDAAGGRRIGNPRPFGPQARIGLGSAAADAVAAARPRDPNAEARRAAQNYYERNLQQNEELLNIWRTLGVA
jgi:hypothetical protein